MKTTTATLEIPHGGAGTHTLAIAIEVPNDMIDDPDLLADILQRVEELVVPVIGKAGTDFRHNQDRETAAQVAADLDVETWRIFSPELSRQVAHARQEMFRRLHDRHGWSLSRIGRCVGRDHTTVLHGVRQARKRLCSEEGCDSRSMGGGRWCYDHFQRQAAARKRAERLKLAVPA